MKNILKLFAPSILLEYWKSYRSPWKGDYTDWETARLNCGTYNSEVIFNKVFESTLQVKNNSSLYERDSVLFDKKEYSWPLVAALTWSRLELGELQILDFGGALGSSFYQNKEFLDLKKTKWIVVEQEHFIRLGNSNIADSNLKFEPTIEMAVDKYKINFVLISGTLQYLKDPYSVLHEILRFKPKYVFLDRLSIVESVRDIITKQTVCSDIYEGSYPCRFFCKKNIFDMFASDYDIIAEFDSFVLNDGLLNFKFKHKDIGAILKLKS